MHPDPAVAAAAQALARLDGIPINQTILSEAESAIEAATCGVSGCRLLNHPDGLHDWELRQDLERVEDSREQLASALGALLDVHGHPDEAFVQACRLILNEHGSTDARSSSH